MTDIEYATLAGFFDADGTLGIYLCASGPRGKHGQVWKYPRLTMSVSGIHHRSIARYREAFGVGQLYLDAKERRRFATHPLWTWSTSGANAQNVLRALLPYLCVKKEQAEAACALPIKKRGDRFTSEERTLRVELADRIVQLKRGVA